MQTFANTALSIYYYRIKQKYIEYGQQFRVFSTYFEKWRKKDTQKIGVKKLLTILAMNFHRIRFNG
jgi:hypothetical protein